MDKQQLEAIRARDADDYAAADVLRKIRSAGNTDPELEATINMIADRRNLLAAYDALAAEIESLRARLAEAELVITNYRLASKPEYARAEERLAEADALLREAREVMEALSEQQAMADDFYKPVLAKLDTYLAREKP